MLTGKIVILVGTIGLAILINIIHLIIPILSSDPRKYINDHYGISFVSCKYYDTGTNQLQNVVTVDNLSEVDRDTLYYANIAQKHNTNQLSAYLDIAGGLTNIYQPLDGSNNDTNLNSPYGELTTQKYVIPNTQPIKIDNNHAMPLIHIGFTNDSKQYIKSIKYYVYGLPLE
jgi:hypothetical protein